MKTLDKLKSINALYKKLQDIQALNEFDAKNAILWIKLTRDWMQKAVLSDSRLCVLNEEFQVVNELDNAFHSCLLAINADDLKTVYLKFRFLIGWHCLFETYTETKGA